MRKQGNKIKKLILPLAIVALVILSIAIVLAGNKKAIDNANKPVDRTKIPVAVTTAKVGVAALNVNAQYPALIQPSDEAMLYAQTSGMIAYLNVELGKQVSKGQVIGRLDTRILEINLKNAEVNVKSASVNKAKLLDDYNRSKDLYDNKAGLEVNMLNAKNNYDNAVNSYDNSLIQVNLIKQQIANANIIAPLSGIISAYKVKQGEFINPGTAIATISNINTVKTTVFADQQMTYQLKMGQQANITSPTFGEQSFSGKIIYISPIADANHNYQIDLLITNKEGIALKGGTDVQVSFNTIAQKEVLQIPTSAIMTDAKEPYVFVVANNKATIKNIKTGIKQNDKVEVLSGLAANETVITSGQINLKDGSIINILN